MRAKSTTQQNKAMEVMGNSFDEQVVGKKYVRLYPASLSEELYPHSESMLKNSSQVDLDNMDPDEFPKIQNVEFWDCVLELAFGGVLHLAHLAHQLPDICFGTCACISFQFFKLSEEEASKDPIYFVLARRQNDDDDEDEIICLKEKKGGSGQDVHSVPGSPMMDTTSSSFGSGSSSVVNLSKEREEIIDPFLQMGGYVNQQRQVQQSTGFDLVSADSLFSDYTIFSQLSPLANRATDPNDSLDQSPRIHMPQHQQQQLQIQNHPYSLSMPTTQIDTQHQLQNQQLQFIHTAVPQP